MSIDALPNERKFPKNRVYKLLQRLYWWLRQKPTPLTVQEALQAFSKKNSKVNFVEIGANDGITDDPLFPFIIKEKWKGILVEPSPSVFRSLLKNYESYDLSGLFFENAAIAATDGEVRFYSLKKGIKLSPGVRADLISSLNKENVMKHYNLKEGESSIEEQHVPALTFDSLLRKYKVETVQLICIDAEGYDFEIIKQIDFVRLGVELLIYEHAHLSDQDYSASLRLMKKLGFRLYHKFGDTIAVKK